MTSIDTNAAALRAQAAMMIASKAAQPARAGLPFAGSVDEASCSAPPEVARMSQGIRNVNDGISQAETADSALSELTNLVQHVRDIAVRSSSGTVSDADRAGMQTEVSRLSAQIISIVGGSTFNGHALFESGKGSSATHFSIAEAA